MNAEIQEQEVKLADLITEQEGYKAINKAYPTYKKNPQSLVRSGLTEEQMRTVQNWVPRYSYEKLPIEGWRLSNLSATVRNTKKRIEELTKREAEAEAAGGENKEFAFVGGTIIHNYDEDRVQLDYDSKPEAETITILKQNGWHWSPTNGVWQRQLTDAAKNNAEYITKSGQWSPEAVAERKEKQTELYQQQRED